MNGESPAFVDTNVLVYAYDDSEPRRQALAEELVLRLMTEDRIRLSTQVLQEFFVTITRKVENPREPSEAIDLLGSFMLWPILAIDASLVQDAAVLSVKATISLWDALIVVAARRSGAAVLYTEDLNHRQVMAGVRIINPFV